MEELEIIIAFFDQYSLITQKKAEFLLFKEVFILIKNKEHLTNKGLKKIVALRANLNLGLSKKLQPAFHNIVPVEKPLVLNQQIPNPNWIAGFTSGEGYFYIKISKSNTNKLGEAVTLVFDLTQHNKDELLIKSFIEYFGCGIVYYSRNAIVFRVSKFKDIVNKIIPFFKEHKIQGVKYKDFDNFCFVAEMMREGKHLTAEGLYQIREIKAEMNKGRKFD